MTVIEKIAGRNLFYFFELLSNQAFTAQRNLAERARLLVLHSSEDGRTASGAISQ